MMRFLQNLFSSPEERHIRRVVSETGSSAAITVIRRVPMAGLVERIQFERKGDRVLTSTTTIAGQANEELSIIELSLADFDSAFRDLGLVRVRLTAKDRRGVKDGESYLVVWADADRANHFFIRWPVTNGVLRSVLEKLLRKQMPPTPDSERSQSPRG